MQRMTRCLAIEYGECLGAVRARKTASLCLRSVNLRYVVIQQVGCVWRPQLLPRLASCCCSLSLSGNAFLLTNPSYIPSFPAASEPLSYLAST